MQKAVNEITTKKQGKAFAIERKKTILAVQEFIKNFPILYTNESVCKYTALILVQL